MYYFFICLLLTAWNSRTVLDDNLQAVLNRLPTARGASFDSGSEEHSPTCLPSTRVELLEEINSWAIDSKAEAIFWLNGMAGTGKSTISRTVARSFSAQARLGASFFFKRGEADRGNIAKVFSTLAIDMTNRIPAVAASVKSALDDDALVCTRGTREQFDQLFLKPLSAINSDTKAAPIIFVLDALDECEDESDIKLLIRLFFQAKKELQIPIKILLTSRPELPLRLEFALQGAHQDLVLHEISRPLVERDIYIFLQHRLDEVRRGFNASVAESRQLYPDWPGHRAVQGLAAMSVPLFIFAATLCLFIGDRKHGNPQKQLLRVLNQPMRGGRATLGSIYLLVLHQQVDGFERVEVEHALKEFRDIIGPIVVLMTPLSANALSSLLGISQQTIEDRLDLLHSVLQVPESPHAPIRLLHLSFRDFLVSPGNRDGNPFWVDEQQTHAVLAARCLKVLHRLRKDMCGIGFPGGSVSDINTERITSCLPSEVQYASLYWVKHIAQSDVCVSDESDVYAFLKLHFLHWIEALALIGRFPECLGFLQLLQLQVPVRDICHDHYPTIYHTHSTLGN